MPPITSPTVPIVLPELDVEVGVGTEKISGGDAEVVEGDTRALSQRIDNIQLYFVWPHPQLKAEHQSQSCSI